MFVVVGYLLHDVLDIDGKIVESPGGSATYSSITAKKLGMKVGIVSRVGKDYKYKNMLKGLDTTGIGFQDKTTVCYDTYRNGERSERIENIGLNITKQDFPDSFLDVDAIHIGPVINEVDKKLVKFVKKNTSALITADIQGFIRKEKDTRIIPKKFDSGILKYIDVLHCSQEDAADAKLDINRVAKKCMILLLTKSKRGSEILFDGKKIKIPAFQTTEKDPTGAGDTYMAGFVRKFLETQDIKESGLFASAVASFCVEDVGIKGLKSEKHVKCRINKGIKLL